MLHLHYVVGDYGCRAYGAGRSINQSIDWYWGRQISSRIDFFRGCVDPETLNACRVGWGSDCD